MPEDPNPAPLTFAEAAFLVEYPDDIRAIVDAHRPSVEATPTLVTEVGDG